MGIVKIGTLGSVKGMFYLSSLLLHAAVKQVWCTMHFCNAQLPDSLQESDMHAAIPQH